MKKYFAGITMIAFVLVLAGQVTAATSDDVSATVTAQLVSVSVTDGTVDYGVLVPGDTKDTTASGVNETQTATNDGNVDESLSIKSSDAASAGAEWNLAASAGADAFTHEFSTNGGTGWTPFDVDNNAYTTLASGVGASGGSQTFDLRIGTPTASTDSAEHTVTVTVLATAL